MSGSTIRDMTVALLVELDHICSNIQGRAVFKNQLLRAASSIGANIHEAKYAQSDADFINKFEIALKECYETEYWLEILVKVKAIDEHTYQLFQNNYGSLRRKLIASITTVKAKRGK